VLESYLLAGFELISDTPAGVDGHLGHLGPGEPVAKPKPRISTAKPAYPKLQYLRVHPGHLQELRIDRIKGRPQCLAQSLPGTFLAIP
jgi:hypothetical protein